MPFGNTASIKGSVCSSAHVKSAAGSCWSKQTAGALARLRFPSHVGPLERGANGQEKHSGLTSEGRRTKIRAPSLESRKNPVLECLLIYSRFHYNGIQIFSLCFAAIHYFLSSFNGLFLSQIVPMWNS